MIEVRDRSSADAAIVRSPQADAFCTSAGFARSAKTLRWNGDEVRLCGKDPEIIRMFGGSPAFEEPMAMSLDEAEAWYEQVGSDPNPLHWAIELQGRLWAPHACTPWLRPTGAPAMPWVYWIVGCSEVASADE